MQIMTFSMRSRGWLVASELGSLLLQLFNVLFPAIEEMPAEGMMVGTNGRDRFWRAERLQRKIDPCRRGPGFPIP